MLNTFYDRFIYTNSLKYKDNNFYLLNLPFVILPVSVLVAIAEKNDKSLNLELYYSVKESVGASLKKEFEIDFGFEGERGLEFMQSFFTASGWGKFEIIDLDKENARAIVGVMHSPVSLLVKTCKSPCDTFLRGFIAGVFSIYFKKNVDCVEVKCMCMGQTSCEFVVKPLGEFNFESGLTRNQLIDPKKI